MTTAEVVAQAVADLEAEHYLDPFLANLAHHDGGCIICWPKDGGWPCTTRMIADDLRRLL